MSEKGRIGFLVLLVSFFLLHANNDGISKMIVGKKAKIGVTSTAFKQGGMIPVQYSCAGENISPPLAWDNIPNGTKSIALICDDPDAPMGTWVHWVIFNMPANTTGLSEDISSQKSLRNGAIQGLNDFHRLGYGGPCPPRGTHRYYFKVYALDTLVDLSPGATKAQLLEAMEGHVVADGQLMGKFRR